MALGAKRIIPSFSVYSVALSFFVFFVLALTCLLADVMTLSPQLSARRQDVAASRGADRGGEPCIHDDAGKAVDGRPRAGLERAARPGIERDQVHLRRNAGDQPHQ